MIDGRVHKIADAVDFGYDPRDYLQPWRIRSESRVDLRFFPMRERRVRVPFVELHQLIGTFSGTVIDDTGERVPIDDMVGLAESVRARW